MGIKEQIIELVERKSQAARSAFPEQEDILPNDAIYLARIHSLNGFAALVADMCAQANLPLPKALSLALRDDMRALMGQQFPYISGVFSYLKEYAERRQGVTA